MSEKAKTDKDSFTDIAQSAFGVLYHAVMRRDESFVTPEVMRVARALCAANGGQPDVLVHNGVPEFAGHSNHWVMSERYISMAWTRYVGQATCAIANLEAHRQEEADRLKQQEKSYDNETAKPAPDLKAVDIPVGFSGMNDGEDVKFVAIDPSNPNRVTDSLSHSDLAAMVAFLATIFDEGPDGDSAVCRQTGKEFFAVKMGYKGDGKQSPEVIRKWLIRWATLEIVGKAPMVDGSTIYWRKRPIIELERGVLKIYARVAFGP